jgi:hypothetical protein
MRLGRIARSSDLGFAQVALRLSVPSSTLPGQRVRARQWHEDRLVPDVRSQLYLAAITCLQRWPQSADLWPRSLRIAPGEAWIILPARCIIRALDMGVEKCPSVVVDPSKAAADHPQIRRSIGACYPCGGPMTRP